MRVAGMTRADRLLHRAIQRSARAIKPPTPGAIAAGLAKDATFSMGIRIPARWLVVPKEWL